MEVILANNKNPRVNIKKGKKETSDNIFFLSVKREIAYLNES